jgi:hypothetical protein
VYATRGLVTVLLELAADAEPGDVSAALAATAAGDLDAADADPALDPETPVFTDFYLPGVGDAVERVFGMDLSVPAGQTHGRFVSHPRGGLDVTLADDLAATMLVAVPPWEEESVAAFDRSGRRLPLELVDAEPPEEALD